MAALPYVVLVIGAAAPVLTSTSAGTNPVHFFTMVLLSTLSAGAVLVAMVAGLTHRKAKVRRATEAVCTGVGFAVVLMLLALAVIVLMPAST